VQLQGRPREVGRLHPYTLLSKIDAQTVWITAVTVKHFRSGNEGRPLRMVHIGCTPKPGVPMDVSYFSEQTPQERDGRQRGSEPTPLMPLLVCILAVGMAMALVQVSWASPLLGGTVVLVVVATLRNRVEEAQQTAVEEGPGSQETFQAPSGPDKGRREPRFQQTARAGRRFKGDRLWGLN
jgi:hypothetical protein